MAMQGGPTIFAQCPLCPSLDRMAHKFYYLHKYCRCACPLLGTSTGAVELDTSSRASAPNTLLPLLLENLWPPRQTSRISSVAQPRAEQDWLAKTPQLPMMRPRWWSWKMKMKMKSNLNALQKSHCQSKCQDTVNFSIYTLCISFTLHVSCVSPLSLWGYLPVLYVYPPWPY